MKRSTLRQELREIILEVLESSESHEMHRCVNGKVAPMGSPACVVDIEFRIQDAIIDRNECSNRTDARVHYNGLLNILRRKLRRAKKLQADN